MNNFDESDERYLALELVGVALTEESGSDASAVPCKTAAAFDRSLTWLL